jgi:hypothetical protein
VLKVVAVAPAAFQYASGSLTKNRDFALRAVKANGLALQYMSPAFQADRQIVATAVTQNEAAVLYSHVACRAEAGVQLPWDPDNTSLVAKADFDDTGTKELTTMYTGEDGLGMPWSKWGRLCEETYKAVKMIQFSALPTANMGQGNYYAACAMLDKMTIFERPELESVTFMWGAVTNIGMRLKAFGSQDFMNYNPEGSTTVDEARSIFALIGTFHDVPEWIHEQMMDPESREGFVTLTAGGGTGGGWRPGEDASLFLPPGYVPVEPPSKKEHEVEEKTQRSQQLQAPSTPLSSWPGMQGADCRPGILAEGARVRLVGMRMKNGELGTLVKKCKDGRWKIQVDNDQGIAALKPAYFQVLGPDADASSLPPPPAVATKTQLQAQEAVVAVAPSPKAKVREAYSVVGSWSNWSEPQEMIWSYRDRCWKFKFRLSFSTESFQILVDGSWEKCLHPLDKQVDGVTCTEYRVAGPDSKQDCRGLHWTVGNDPRDPGVRGAQYEVKLFLKDGQVDKLRWDRVRDVGKTNELAEA